MYKGRNDSALILHVSRLLIQKHYRLPVLTPRVVPNFLIKMVILLHQKACYNMFFVRFSRFVVCMCVRTSTVFLIFFFIHPLSFIMFPFDGLWEKKMSNSPLWQNYPVCVLYCNWFQMKIGSPYSFIYIHFFLLSHLYNIY